MFFPPFTWFGKSSKLPLWRKVKIKQLCEFRLWQNTEHMKNKLSFRFGTSTIGIKFLFLVQCMCTKLTLQKMLFNLQIISIHFYPQYLKHFYFPWRSKLSVVDCIIKEETYLSVNENRKSAASAFPLSACGLKTTKKIKVFLRIQVRASSQTKGLEHGWKGRARLGIGVWGSRASCMWDSSATLNQFWEKTPV